ncbi:uncharacterized protein PFL1_01718 [Pseudozyma flocculosa PF-1]|uniref:uncharacterized protein n=1 Tax=Pseudozyma flocculosa PF-1 TaxID=1277687 RepID=UPI0004560ACA|nr:uncharacterized protein PFL1_01718 [Pseudozyma flocculosa PF-1]EPQ30819.1 hypothetical protein PFL1_01718 [Pseudozyma flocculosa PF-1]
MSVFSSPVTTATPDLPYHGMLPRAAPASRPGSTYHSSSRDTRSGFTTPLHLTSPATPTTTQLSALVEAVAGKGSKSVPETGPAATAVAAKLQQFGVGIGPGVNPSVVAGGADGGAGGSMSSNNPPIVNTGNSGPMCVQPGDWLCGTCGFVNWRRRKVCMRCYPFAEGNELASNLQHGAMLAAQIAGGLDPTSEQGIASLEALMAGVSKAKSAAFPGSGPVTGSVPRDPHAISRSATGSHHSSPMPFAERSPAGTQTASLYGQLPRHGELSLETHSAQALRSSPAGLSLSGQLGRPGVEPFDSAPHTIHHLPEPMSMTPRNALSMLPQRQTMMRPDDREETNTMRSIPKPIGTKTSARQQASTEDQEGTQASPMAEQGRTDVGLAR